MIQQLQQIFRSIIKSLEILYVIEDAKPCARILVFEDDLNKAKVFLENQGLNYSISYFKVLKRSLQSDFYSDKSIKISKDDSRKGHFFVYLSKNKDLSEKAKIAEEKNNHFELGLLLGYPKCCCDFFEKNFDENNTDLTLMALKYSHGFEFSFYTNIAARHFDVSLLSHFPHNFNCEESIKIAKNNLKIIEKHSKQLAVTFSGILQSAVVYTLEEGIFLFRNYEKNNNEIIYRDILSTEKSKLYFLLNSNNKLKGVDKDNFSVNDITVHGDKFGVMVFA
ncbi:hypothetical protein HYX06_03620 [Candidatus Woesearchaeota archaeon]|nr:hypothetical protein [Candidatus Woesearchaeota archaeon]